MANADYKPPEPKMGNDQPPAPLQAISQKNTTKRFMPPDNPALRQEEHLPADLSDSMENTLSNTVGDQKNFKFNGYKTKLQGFWVNKHQHSAQSGRNYQFKMAHQQRQLTNPYKTEEPI